MKDSSAANISVRTAENVMLTMRAIIVMATVVVTVSCSRRENLAPYGWEKVSPEIDSLTLALENGWNESVDNSELFPLVDRLETLGTDSDTRRLMKVRGAYWRGRLLARQWDSEEGYALMDSAIALNDSAAHPYETYRARWTVEPADLPYNIVTYEYLKDQAEFFERSGDLMLAAARWMDIGMFLNDLGQYGRALPYLDRSDSLSALGGFDMMITGNRLNRAKLHYQAGNVEETERLLRALVSDPMCTIDEDFLNLVYTNLYDECGDTAALFQAYRMVEGTTIPQYQERETYFQGCIAGYYCDRGMPDSARHYIELAMKRFPTLGNSSQRLKVLDAACRIELAAGNRETATRYLAQRLEEMRRVMDETRRSEVLNAQFNDMLVAKELEREKRAYRARFTAVAVSAGCVAALLITLLLVFRRSQRQSVTALEQRLDLERSRREALAMKIDLEQKKSLITTIEDSLSSDDSGSLQRVESAIKTHNAEARASQSSFEKVFSELGPAFAPKLRQACPALSETDIKMLSLIAIGLPGRQIAATLGIRAESVKQARWRIRKKLGLTGDETIESYLDRFTSDLG